MEVELTAVDREVPEGGYIAWVQEIPGALTQGETLARSAGRISGDRHAAAV
jgi:predicted RNase H-like HicB family nuclease